MVGAMREIHSAYGVTLKGVYDDYHWYDGSVDEVIMEIYVNDQRVYLGSGHFIISEDKTGQRINMEDDKDYLCYWLSTHKMDDYELENFFLKQYHGSVWKHFARQQMMKEKMDAVHKADAERRAKERQSQIDEAEEYARKKKLHVIRKYDELYLVKLSGKNKDCVGRVTDDQILQFAKEYPGNGVEIVEKRSLMV